MRIILSGDSLVNKIIYRQYVPKKEYRWFNFCVIDEHDDNLLVFNTLNRMLIEFGREEIDSKNNIDFLVNYGFYVEELQNDLQFCREVIDIVKVLREPYNIVNNYTIFTSLNCNANCFYCFEKSQNSSKVDMNETVANNVVKFIHKMNNREKIFIRWFGGEPLLNISCIDIISHKLKDLGMEFESSIVTNGVLINQKCIDKCINEWQVRNIQITIDGTKDKYLQIKNYSNKTIDYFEIVINNIENLLRCGIGVVVRLNISENNCENIVELLDFLLDKFSRYSNLTIDPHSLFEKCGNIDLMRTIDDEKKVRETQLFIMKKVDEMGLYSNELRHYLKTSVCTADSGHTITILPSGRLGVCEHSLVDHFIGWVDEEVLDLSEVDYFKNAYPEMEECAGCSCYLECNRQSVCDGVVHGCSLGRKQALLQETIMKMRYERRKG